MIHDRRGAKAKATPEQIEIIRRLHGTPMPPEEIEAFRLAGRNLPPRGLYSARILGERLGLAKATVTDIALGRRAYSFERRATFFERIRGWLERPIP